MYMYMYKSLLLFHFNYPKVPKSLVFLVEPCLCSLFVPLDVVEFGDFLFFLRELRVASGYFFYS